MLIALFGAIAAGWLLVAPTDAHQHLACVGAEPFRHHFVPSPQSCAHYILCIEGASHIGECEAGMHFDGGRGVCAPAHLVDCTQCASIGLVNLPHPELCDHFFECNFGGRKERTCPAGHNFDRTVGACNRAELVLCPGGEWPEFPDDGSPPVDPPFPFPPDDGVLPTCIGGQVHHGHSSVCGRFYLCVKGNLWEHECPSQLHWNERRMACDLPESAKCGHVGGGGGGGDWGDGGGGDWGDGGGGGGGEGGVGDEWNWGGKKPKGTPPKRRLVRLAKDDRKP